MFVPVCVTDFDPLLAEFGFIAGELKRLGVRHHHREPRFDWGAVRATVRTSAHGRYHWVDVKSDGLGV